MSEEDRRGYDPLIIILETGLRRHFGVPSLARPTTIPLASSVRSSPLSVEPCLGVAVHRLAVLCRFFGPLVYINIHINIYNFWYHI